MNIILVGYFTLVGLVVGVLALKEIICIFRLVILLRRQNIL